MGSTVEMAKLLVLPLLCVALAAVAFGDPQDFEDEPRSSDVNVDSDDEPREDELGLIDNGDEDDDFDVIGELDRTDEKEVSDKEQLEPSDRRSPTRCRRRMRCRRRCKCGGIPCTYCSCKRCPTRATRATATANLNLGGATYTVTLQKSHSSKRSRCSALGGFRMHGRCMFRRRRRFRRKG